MPTGLGDERLWISATNDNTGTTTALNDLGAASISQYLGTGVTVAADTDEGGTYALSFDGSSTRSWIYSPSLQSNGGYFGWSAWFKVDTIGSIMSIVGGNASSNRRGGELGIDSSGALFLTLNKGTSGVSNVSVTSPTSLNTDQWYHAAASGDGTTARLYLDGVEVASGLFTGFLSPWDGLMRIGSAGSGAANGDYGTDAYFFDGLIDDARFYDRTLTQTDITHLSSSRGVIGPSYSGLGDEQLWLSPTNNNTGTSTAFNDQSGNGNNGTAIGTTVVVDTSEGGTYAYSLDGGNDYIDCGNGIAPTAGYSASAWVNFTSFPSTNVTGTIIEKGFDGANEPFTLNVRGTTLLRSYSFDGSTHGIDNYSHGMSVGTWYHIATTFDGSTWRLFVDGSEVATAADSTALAQNSLNTYIGASFITSSVSRFINAKLDDIRVYYRALTQAEITHLATSRGIEGSPGGPPTPDVFFNPFKSQAFHTLTGKRIR